MPKDLSLDRLAGLLEFTKQAAKLRTKPTLSVRSYPDFVCFEEALQDMPGLRLGSVSKDDDGDEVWLELERLRESRPPFPDDALLATWIELHSDPAKAPTLKYRVARDELVIVGALDVSMPTASSGEDAPEVVYITLDGFEGRNEVESALQAYIDSVWRPWAAHEKRVRASIAFYSKLFTVQQKLSGNLVDNQLELVWGVGVALWGHAQGSLTYPLLTQLVDLALDAKTMALRIRPRSNEPQLELDAFTVLDDASGQPELEKATRAHFSANPGLNPFERNTFEPVLQAASSMLDAKGNYWPAQTAPANRSLPSLTKNLIVTDTWVIFLRPRSQNGLIQDLARFEAIIEESAPALSEVSPATAALVTDPSTEQEDVELPTYRGVSHIDSGAGGDSRAADLFFPLPYNDEQVRLVQLLERHDGVVVQGPPGTGKTHTIANVISHYLAKGCRVLVTSHKDPALAVLRDKLPEQLRPLAISLLTSEAEGMRQFEDSVNKISAEISTINKGALEREVRDLDAKIDSLHVDLARLDGRMRAWARKNMEPVDLDGERLEPAAMARVVADNPDLAWIPDAIDCYAQYKPRFSNQDILALRQARRALGEDLDHLGVTLPTLEGLPDTARLRRVHEDLQQLAMLKSRGSSASLPSFNDFGSNTIETANAAAEQVRTLKRLRAELEDMDQPWDREHELHLRQNGAHDPLLAILDALRQDVRETVTQRADFISRPVMLPDGFERHPDAVAAAANLGQGRSAFGISGLFGKGDAKRLLEAVVVVNAPPAGQEDWKHVHAFVSFRKRCREILVRWNALCAELPLPRIEGDKPEYILEVSRVLSVCDRINECLTLERTLVLQLTELFPAWEDARETPYTPVRIEMALDTLNHNLARHRLSDTYAVKESLTRAVHDAGGRIAKRFRTFLNERLGAEHVTEQAMQAEWQELVRELTRLHGLREHFDTVTRVTAQIEDSGAPLWSKQLSTQAFTGTVDDLLPDNWLAAWRVRRLATHVSAIDSRAEFATLMRQRAENEATLARSYQDAVSKRAWLQLYSKATGAVRAALEAYRTAIRRIGKGTGKRAGRFRQDARNAAGEAQSAIPCWIMPHHRISESLPAELGAFDLVIIDEASQSDLTALPAILRAKKVLIVGDDKQVSPDGVGLEEEKIRKLMAQYLPDQVELYRQQLSPDRSIYDLFKVVFAKSGAVLREHFRCVAPIIEYSRREFYSGMLVPLRLPRASERLDPPLIDVLVADGYRDKEHNPGEARYIVEEISRIVADPKMAGRTIGVVSLIGNEQALRIMTRLTEELGEETITRFEITCGDARTFQGKERDIMFLSMVAAPGNVHALTTEAAAQRYNVAASRARDRMYLVRSVTLEDLSASDKLRRGLISHFQAPFVQNEDEIGDMRARCDSDFEREVFDVLHSRGYRVTSQVRAGPYRIDLVVEGDDDTRLAIECDGDRWHGPDKWDDDMMRQRVLERAGWRFWRCFASTFVMHREEVVADLVATLSAHGIEPTGAEGPVKSVHTEYRRVEVFADLTESDEDNVDPEADRPHEPVLT